MNKFRVVTIVGTRPELIKLCRIIPELDAHTDHVLVHTGQNYDFELNEVFFKELGIRAPDRFLDAVGETYAETIGNVIAKTDQLLIELKPDAILLLGDTNSCLAAIAAKRRHIPIFHMEAGNRCFDARVPEETNRKIVDHTSDINLPYTEHARRYLIAEGLRPETVIKTGSPMREILDHYAQEIHRSDVLDRMDVAPGQYIIASAHREENVDAVENLRELAATFRQVAAEFGRPVIVSTHPRTRQRLADSGLDIEADANVRFVKPLGFIDYIALQSSAFCVLSDSGTLTEEASIVGFPAVMLRQAHERPEGMDEGTVIMAGRSPQAVINAIEVITQHHADESRKPRLVQDYEPNNVSAKVVRVILSYIEYVNRTVWFK
jgi:UDP-N-acetylglucosamine 2-epimerase (non-hydrolysing)